MKVWIKCFCSVENISVQLLLESFFSPGVKFSRPYKRLWPCMTALLSLMCLPTGARQALSAVEDDWDRHVGPWGVLSAPQPQQALSSSFHWGVCHPRYCWSCCSNWQQVCFRTTFDEDHCFHIQMQRKSTLKVRVYKLSKNLYFFTSIFLKW